MPRLLILLLLFSAPVIGDDSGMADNQSPIAIAIHGGAGTIDPARLTAERERDYRSQLEAAVRAGYEKLQSGATSREAVIAAILVMEDSPLFNAGVGAVLNHAGNVELDASIMDGRDSEAGAIAGVRHVRNPILLADLVLKESPHVMLIGEGAEEFGEGHGIELVENEYFITERRQRQLDRVRASEGLTLSEDPSDDHEPGKQLGTVGAVAIDRSGTISAGTSTGGMTNKRFGRVGDSPIIGAGTYADSNCGVSATGHGEYFIRAVVAYDICARVRYTGASLEDAAEEVVNRKLVGMGADGGVIAIDRYANVTMPFNSTGMYRASIDREGKLTVQIFKE